MKNKYSHKSMRVVGTRKGLEMHQWRRVLRESQSMSLDLQKISHQPHLRKMTLHPMSIQQLKISERECSLMKLTFQLENQESSRHHSYLLNNLILFYRNQKWRLNLRPHRQRPIIKKHLDKHQILPHFKKIVKIVYHPLEMRCLYQLIMPVQENRSQAPKVLKAVKL